MAFINTLYNLWPSGDKLEAKAAYDKKAKELKGEFVRIAP